MISRSVELSVVFAAFFVASAPARAEVSCRRPRSTEFVRTTAASLPLVLASVALTVERFAPRTELALAVGPATSWSHHMSSAGRLAPYGETDPGWSGGELESGGADLAINYDVRGIYHGAFGFAAYQINSIEEGFLAESCQQSNATTGVLLTYGNRDRRYWHATIGVGGTLGVAKFTDGRALTYGPALQGRLKIGKHRGANVALQADYLIQPLPVSLGTEWMQWMRATANVGYAFASFEPFVQLSGGITEVAGQVYPIPNSAAGERNARALRYWYGAAAGIQMAFGSEDGPAVQE